MINVLVVDDDPLVRAGLSLILGGAEDIVVVGEASDGQQAVEAVGGAAPVDVVLMDIRMPRMDGLEATAAIQAAETAAKVIVLTTFDADDYVVRALGHGASGFLLKDTPPPQLVDAVRKVAAGQPMLSPSVTGQLIRHLTDNDSVRRATDARDQIGTLTDRELEVAHGIGRGWSNAEIAGELHMSVSTVKAHVSRIFTKLDASNRVQIAVCMHDAGLL